MPLVKRNGRHSENNFHSFGGASYTKMSYWYALLFKNSIMKKCLLLIAAVIAVVSLYAQDDIVIHASNKIDRKATPQQVIDSLKKRFPNAKAVQYYKTKAAGIKAGWTI